MLLSRTQDDLFESSTMTFGQHLQELQVCLFRAIAGLAIGCAIGLIPAVSVPVVRYLSDPAEKALADYYQTAAEAKAISPEQKEMFRGAGYTSDADLARIVEIVKKYRVSANVVLRDRKKVLEQLGIKPDASLSAGGAAKGDELIKIIDFKPIADDPRIHMKTLNTQESFMIYLKASMLVGVVLASPWVFYQIWQFVAAGLYPHERRYVHIFLPMSLVLFLAGAAIAYFLRLQQGAGLPAELQPHDGHRPRLAHQRVDELRLLLAAGLRRQLPASAGDAFPGAHRADDA